jgi:hypothetical protein
MPETAPIEDKKVPRLFLITECGGTNGWIAQAESLQEAITFFQQEILQTRSSISVDLQYNWCQYLQLETKSSMKHTCFMQKCQIGRKTYYVELLTTSSKRVAWLPSSFK